MGKNLLTKFVIALFLFILLSTYYILHATFTIAADAVPGPAPIDCNQTSNPEFNSDRPYQASPCGGRPITYFCGNKVVIDLGSVSTPYCDRKAGNLTSCPAKIHKDQSIVVDLTNVQLPILGNTQQIPNSQNASGQLDDATRMNSYVSSYLNGTINQAEYGQTDPNKIVDFSGPLNKLLPQAIAEAARIKTIASASLPVTYTPDTNGESQPSPTTQPENHDQIVACAHKTQLLWFVLKADPYECYKNGTPPSGDLYRLSSWNLGFFENINDTILNFIAGKIPNNFIGIITKDLFNLDRWRKKTPPLPWEDQYKNNSMLYQKNYNEWKGQYCAIVPIPFTKARFLFCTGIPGVSNQYADLFPYIPIANTVDKQGAQMVTSTSFQAPKATLENTSYKIIHSPMLYVAHSLENFSLSNLLISSYIPQSVLQKNATAGPNPPLGGSITTKDVEDNSRTCKIISSRTNPGDDTTFGSPPSQILVDVHYDVTQIQCSTPVQDCRPVIDSSGKPTGRQFCGGWNATCQSEIYATIPSLSKTPYADEIWNNTVAGSDSIFRRIYPKPGASAPVSCIADTPAVSPATYTIGDGSSRGISIFRIIEPDGSSVIANNSSAKSVDAQLYYPHYGGVLDYFLNGIQTALRPKGYGDPSPISGQYCNNIACGELPKNLPKASGSCQLNGISSKVGSIPQSLKDIISAASQTYKTPPNLILGIMYGEGLFKGSNQKEWTDQNVKNWATCQKIPDCNETGDDNFMGFNGSDFTDIVPHIIKDIQKLDPTRTKLSQCNLLDSIYAIAYSLNTTARGGGALANQTCYGIKMSSFTPTSCTWNDNQYESAIRIAEVGTAWGNTNCVDQTGQGRCTCFTLPGSCAGGGGFDAACLPGDNCEKNGGSGNTSHNACVWDVGHGK